MITPWPVQTSTRRIKTLRRFSFSSLKVRLLLLVLLAVVPALGLILYTDLEERRIAIANARRDALRVARIVATNKDRLIQETQQLLMVLAQLPPVRTHDSRSCSKFFSRLLQRYPLYANLGAVAPDGDVFCSAIPFTAPTNVTDRAYFRRALEKQDFAVGEYQIGRITGKASINFGYPVLDDAGQVRAVVFAAMDLGWLNRLAAEAQLPKGSVVTLLDQKGTILARTPDPGEWVGKSATEMPVVRAVLAQREGMVEAPDLDGIPRFFGFTQLRGATQAGYLYVSVGIPKEVALAEVNRILAFNLAGLGLVAALALMAAWVIGHWFVLRQVNALVGATKRIATGDLSGRTGLSYGQGELDQPSKQADFRLGGRRDLWPGSTGKGHLCESRGGENAGL